VQAQAELRRAALEQRAAMQQQEVEPEPEPDEMMRSLIETQEMEAKRVEVLEAVRSSGEGLSRSGSRYRAVCMACAWSHSQGVTVVAHTGSGWLHPQVGLRGEDQELLHALLAEQGEQLHSWYWLLGWMRPWTPGQQWLYRCRLGVLQYVFWELVISLVILLCRMFDVYGELTPLCFKHAYPYTTFVISCSQMWALYCLVHFYHATHELLHRVRPLRKFVSVKLIVFATFWQSVAVNLINMAFPKWFDELDLECNFGLPRLSFGVGVQACLICLEMFVASLAHGSIFTYRECRAARVQDRTRPWPPWAAVKHAFHFNDLTLAMRQMADESGKRMIKGGEEGIEKGIGETVLVGSEARAQLCYTSVSNLSLT
jgi:hypothetical protein